MEIFLKIFPELNHLHRLERFKEIKNIIKLDNVNLLALLLIDNTDNYEYFSYKFNVSKNLTEKLLNYRKCFSLMNKEKNFFKEKAYPRTTDPANFGSPSDALSVTALTDTTFTVGIGSQIGGGLVGPLQMELICSILENSTV